MMTISFKKLKRKKEQISGALEILIYYEWHVTLIQFNSVAQSCPTLCHPMDCSKPGFRADHQLPEPTQTHVHCVSDAIQPSHPLLSYSPPTFNLSQHQGLFQWVLCNRWSKYWSFSFSISPPMNIKGWFPLRLTGWISLQSKGLSRVFSSTTVQKHQFFGTHWVQHFHSIIF